MKRLKESRVSTLTWGLRILVLCGFLTLLSFLWNSETVADLLVVYEVTSKPTVDNRCKQWNMTHFVCLPNAMLIGASKCGTTSVFNYLMFHPNVDKTHRRVIINDHNNEIHKFDNSLYPYIPTSIAWGYEMASSPKVPHVDNTIIHYTPQYLYAPSVPYDVRAFYPNRNELKFLVLLRDPVQRALSSYWFKNSGEFQSSDRGSEADFIENFRKEKETRQEYESCLAQSDYVSYDPNKILSSQTRQKNFDILSSCFGNEFRSGALGLRHIDKGIYADQFDRWFQNFHRDQFLILSYEDWLSNPLKYYEQILNFFGQELYLTSSQGTAAAGAAVGGAAAAGGAAGGGPGGGRERGGFHSKEELNFLEVNYLTTKNEKKTKFSEELMNELECYYLEYNQRVNEMLGQEVLKIHKDLHCADVAAAAAAVAVRDVKESQSQSRSRSVMVKQMIRRRD